MHLTQIKEVSCQVKSKIVVWWPKYRKPCKAQNNTRGIQTEHVKTMHAVK